MPVRLNLPAFDPTVGENNYDDVTNEQLAKLLGQRIAKRVVTVYEVGEKVATVLVARGGCCQCWWTDWMRWIPVNSGYGGRRHWCEL